MDKHTPSEDCSLNLDAQTIISNTVVSPIILLDFSESLEKARNISTDRDLRVQATNYHSYDTWNPFSSYNKEKGVRQGLLRQLMLNLQNELADLNKSKVIFVRSDDHGDNVKLHNLMASYFEKALSRLYVDALSSYEEDDSPSPMTYEDFDQGKGVDTYLSLVEHDHIDLSGNTEVVSNIVIKFVVAVPALCATTKPDKFMTVLAQFLKRMATPSMPIQFGVLMSHKDLGAKVAMNVLNFCQDSMEFLEKSAYIEMANHYIENGGIDQQEQNDYIQLVRDYPILTPSAEGPTSEDYADWLYKENNNLLFLSRFTSM